MANNVPAAQPTSRRGAATQRLERMVSQVRRWRSGTDTEPLPVDPRLGESDAKKLRRLIDDSISGKGGEIAARRRASAIAGTFLTLDEEGRENFFRLLADDYDHDDAEVDLAIAAVVRADGGDARRSAEQVLAEALRPRRQRLLRRFIGLEDGLPFLVNLREELLAHRHDDPAMTALDNDLRQLLDGWFDIALLQLERLNWETPAATLEKLIEYEAVHAIESWDDLKGRLGPDRRCYGYFHPLMPGEPLIFVEVALTRGIASHLPDLLDHSAERLDTTDADTAIFYSISNCHRGLAGVSLGDFLIKRVVEQLLIELPGLETFATLSPMPGFRSWLMDALTGASGPADLLLPTEAELLSPGNPDGALDAMRQLIESETAPPTVSLEPLRPIIERLGAHYLVNERKGRRAADPVAHFHLSNGARVEQLNWMANPSATGWSRGVGLMVNYRYMLKHIEANHDQYINHGVVEATSQIRATAEPDSK